MTLEEQRDAWLQTGHDRRIVHKLRHERQRTEHWVVLQGPVPGVLGGVTVHAFGQSYLTALETALGEWRAKVPAG